MEFKIELNSLNNMLETYNERDKILRLVCYASQLVSGLVNSKKLSTLCNQITECRTTARLFDDIPMLMYTLSYGLGKKVSSRRLLYVSRDVMMLKQGCIIGNLLLLLCHMRTFCFKMY